MAAAKRLFDEALWADPEFGLPLDVEPVVLPPADATDAGVAYQWSIISMASRSTPMGPVPDTSWDRSNHQWINWMVNFYGAAPTATVKVRVGGAWVDGTMKVRVGGVWVTPVSIKVRVAGAWVAV